MRGGSQPEVWRGDMIEKGIDEPAAAGAGKKWIMRKSRVILEVRKQSHVPIR